MLYLYIKETEQTHGKGLNKMEDTNKSFEVYGFNRQEDERYFVTVQATDEVNAVLKAVPEIAKQCKSGIVDYNVNGNRYTYSGIQLNRN